MAEPNIGESSSTLFRTRLKRNSSVTSSSEPLPVNYRDHKNNWSTISNNEKMILNNVTSSLAKRLKESSTLLNRQRFFVPSSRSSFWIRYFKLYLEDKSWSVDWTFSWPQKHICPILSGRTAQVVFLQCLLYTDCFLLSPHTQALFEQQKTCLQLKMWWNIFYINIFIVVIRFSRRTPDESHLNVLLSRFENNISDKLDIFFLECQLILVSLSVRGCFLSIFGPVWNPQISHDYFWKLILRR